jgi:cell division transport system permease protein
MLKVIFQWDYLLREAGLGLRRGSWMTWAAISTITILLFLFGLSLQVSWQMNYLLNQFGSQLEITAYLKPSAKGASIEPIAAKFPGVVEVQAVSKEQAWADLVSELGVSDVQDATEQLNGNPLVDVVKVKVSSPEDVQPTALKLAEMEDVDEVQYYPELVKRLTHLNQGLHWAGLAITGLLTVTAIAVITTTIRLILMARQQEIEILQLVGATPTWIALPFLIQGLVFGVFGGAIAWALLEVLQQFVAHSMATKQLDFLQFLTQRTSPGLSDLGIQARLLPLGLLSFGSIVGILGSGITVLRFLRPNAAS